MIAHAIHLKDADVETLLLHDQGVYEKLLDFLEGEEIDLIVISTHGRRRLGHILLGSFTERVARYAPV